MSIANWCIFIAMWLPYVFTIIAKAGAPGMNNREPRQALAKLEGWRKRANWAQMNAFEAFAPFATAVIVAQLKVGTVQANIDNLAIAFIFCRTLHGAFYIVNWSALRSLAWFGGIACVVAIFLQ